MEKAKSAANPVVKKEDGKVSLLVAAGSAAPVVDVEKLDKKQLESLVVALGGKVDGSESDKKLKKRARALMESTKVLNPKAIQDVINSLPDCFGLFIDLTQSVCQACPDKAACQTRFDENAKTGFPQIRRAHVNITTEEAAKKVNPKEVKKIAEKTADTATKEDAKTEASALTMETKLVTKEIANPFERGGLTFKFAKRVMFKKPTTIRGLFEVYDSLFDTEEATNDRKRIKMLRKALDLLTSNGIVQVK